MTRLLCLEKQVVNDEAQVRFARAVVGQRDTARFVALCVRQFMQQFFNELIQVIDLLEFASRVLVEFAVAGQDMQLFEQLYGLPRPDFRRQDPGLLPFGLRPGTGVAISFFCFHGNKRWPVSRSCSCAAKRSVMPAR